MAVLEAGGNAFDAAVAAGFTLQVVEPHLNGPGGEVPILFARGDGTGGPGLLSGQGIAPAGATIEAFEHLGLDLVPGTGLLAATVPGAVCAWLTLLRDHGTQSLDAVLRFAIEYAETGHPLLPRVTATVASVSEHFRTSWPTSAATWLTSDGAPPDAGSLFRNSVLASTYRRLLTRSARTLPGGADRCGTGCLVRRIRRRGDRQILPVSGEGRLRSCPFRISDRGRSGRLDADVRAAGHAGPAGVDAREGRAVVPGTGSAPGADDAGRRRTGWSRPGPRERRGGQAGDGRPRSLVRGRRRRPGGRSPLVHVRRREAGAHRGHGQQSPAAGFPGWAPASASFPGHPGRRPAGPPPPPAPANRPSAARGTTRGDTCHVDVVDRWGNLVSATPSGGWLQSSPVIPELGFPLGTRAQMFWLERGLPNSLAPGKRPRTTLTPSLALRDGVPALAFGTPGRRPAGAVAALLLARPRRRRAGPAGGHRRAGLAHDELSVVLLPAGHDARRGGRRVPHRGRRHRGACAPGATTSRSPGPGRWAGSRR